MFIIYEYNYKRFVAFLTPDVYNKLKICPCRHKIELLITNGGSMDLTKVNRQLVSVVVSKFIVLAELLLALRVVLRFFNGNPDATFIHWVYTNTAVLLEPLRNVFTSGDMVSRGWVVDYVALAS